MTNIPLKVVEMNADKSYSSISMAQKREKLMALVERKKSGKRTMRLERDKTNVKNSEKERVKAKKLNAHFYKRLFQIRRRKVKVLNDVNDAVAKESCSGPMRKKQRLCSRQGGGESDHQSGSSELADIRFEDSTDNHVLPYVDKLLDHWNRGKNAVIFDEQDRLVKVVSFILSLLEDTKKLILIIASSSALSLWETEFSKWSKSINVVTYKGTKGIRAAIRGSKFQVLLSSPEAVVEDMERLKHTKWELLVIDECQRRAMSTHLKKIRMLMADMKLLTVSSELMDNLPSYRHILSLVDCKNVNLHTNADMEMNYDISTLKERLSPFIAYECKFGTPDVEEYWVPVQLSSTQIKQYCSVLVSNADALSSLLRTSSLQDVVTQIRKCCDHPYLVDPTLCNSSKEPSLTDPLAAEINASGKLHLLDKLLLEIKRCGLRALVLFQSAGNSEMLSTGHLLDDLVHQRFGEDTYVHIRRNDTGKKLSNSEYAMRKETLEMFNNVESDRFICLLDYRSCNQSISLSCLDVVILFNSDPNPKNDIKALRRLTINTRCQRLTVFRLYSAYTVEEKALILSKQGTIVDSYISWRSCHRLLSWGATYLFSKLQSCVESEPLFLIDDLVQELSSVLMNTSVETGPTNRSIISNAWMQDGTYSESILLNGENEAHTKESSSIDECFTGNRHSVFWSNLIKQSQLVQENACSRLPWRVQKSNSTRNCFEGINATTSFVRSKARSKRKLLKNVGRKRFEGIFATTSFFVTSKPRSKRKSIKNAGRKWAGTCTPFGTPHACENVTEGGRSISDLIDLSPRTNAGQQSQTVQAHTSTFTPLETEIERIRKEREQITKSHQDEKAMLLSELEKVISEAQKKYGALVHDSETRLKNKLKSLEDYEKLVYVNKLLADILAQNWRDTPSLKSTHKDTSAFNVLQIPASALEQPKNACSNCGATAYLHGHSLAGSEQRFAAHHPRSNPLMFASFCNRPDTGGLSLEPLPNLSTTQTVDKH